MRWAMAILGWLVLAPAAWADGGGPFAAYQGGYGLSVPGGQAVFTTLPVARGTLIERFDRRAGSVTGWRFVHGHFGVPAAAFDGSTTGISGDGHRLVLAEITANIPPRRTRLLLLTGALHVVKRITLPGAYTVDAISPTGRWLYLIHYTSPRNLLRYEVRAYDLRAGRLLRKPVIDPREPDEDMRGTAAARVMSHGGRWAYTLYIRPKGAPFVHALDTGLRTAACIDLPGVSATDVLRLTLDDDSIRVIAQSRTQALIDRRTFAVTRPTPARPHAPRARADHPRAAGGAPAWPAAVIAVALVAALAVLRRKISVRPTQGD